MHLNIASNINQYNIHLRIQGTDALAPEKCLMFKRLFGDMHFIYYIIILMTTKKNFLFYIDQHNYTYTVHIVLCMSYMAGERKPATSRLLV